MSPLAEIIVWTAVAIFAGTAAFDQRNWLWLRAIAALSSASSLGAGLSVAFDAADRLIMGAA